jgi:hypothetical protein
MAATKNTDTAADEIPRGFNLVAAHLRDITVVLNAIEQQMVERNDLLRGTAEAGESRAPIATIADADVLARLDALEGAMSSIPGKMDDLTALVKNLPGLLTRNSEPAPQTLAEAAGLTILRDTATPANGAAKAIAGRIIEHTVAQVQAQAGTEAAPQTRGRGRPADPKKCAHPEDKIEVLESGLRRCTRCGAVLEAKSEITGVVIDEVPALKESGALAVAEKVATEQVAAVKEKLAERIAAEKAPAPAKSREPVYRPIDGKFVEVDPDTLEPLVKASPEPEEIAEKEALPPPEPVKATLDDVRAVAIGYAGKHGKEKLGAVLVKYGAGNLSSVPAEKYDALMAELQAS